ncbi:EAL domain-containing protein [Nitrosophilus kaiyonis]|uniref:EAL domain-containing protein n=1 Tax=Nitrosophilus kaiyonis TaxID=2930200 RepID=UPI0024932DD9|nr:EAL domain-containing protein [Nitrosophilus kaiyonis]
MIKIIKFFVALIFFIFFAIYVGKVFQYEKSLKIYSFENRIDNLLIKNHLILDEIKNIVGNSFVNYDSLVEKLKKFENNIDIIKNNNLKEKIYIDKYLKNITANFKSEKIIIEKIVQISAILKSSYLYLPYLQKEIILSDIKNKKILDAIQEIIEILTYRLYLRDEVSKNSFKKYINILKSKSNYTHIKNFIAHSELVYSMIEKLYPQLNRFKKINNLIKQNIVFIKSNIKDYEKKTKKENIFIEGFLHITMFVFAVLIFYYIYKEQKAEDELKKMAEIDFLTNLPNRYMLLKEMKKRKTENKRYFIVRFDLDNFSYINENFGTAFGDEILKYFASILNKHCRNKVFRVTSDEFVALCDSLDKNDILQFFERLRFDVKSHSKYYITFSAGAYKVDENCDINKLVFYLQSAIFSAKKRGGDNIVFYNRKDPFIKEYEKISKAGTNIRKEIEEAIKNDKFILNFQPILNIKTKKIEKFEVLLRMQKDGKTIFPNDFITMAEQFNLIGKITRIVIDKSFSLSHKKEINLSINLSALDLLDEKLINFIKKSKEKFKIDPQSITFEITETAVINEFSKGISFLEELKDEGFKIAIDDFGVGYSSLRYLNDIPADYIKIDGSFIKNIHLNKKDAEFVRIINKIIKNSGKLSIAEYVENEKILKILEDIDIDYAQGYYIGKPSFIL